MLRVMLICGLALAAPARAQDAAREDPGAAAFATHCAACHGADGQGDGPMAQLLTVEVPDLTRLTARNGGAFPMREVVHQIDGRATRAGHGGPMPVFGALLEGRPGVLDSPDGTVIFTRGVILSLAYYLESIQR
ncbi:hypothetical protein DDZ14_01025 [Maritimibacter sp. 55A14]|uniref:c-type cytochrome n=1 Tax=Maritimibacter sp. 55A14 TaxID=2174844 RepID=UPI000D61A090|nr:c-type cytochrome [Maritimibacter sp. 55A14]PWE34322.1 hypothetical protein DDZ14_01025 [Maritimibacter sp. 55A14]